MKHGKNWKDGSSILSLRFAGEDLEILRKHLLSAGFEKAATFKGDRIYGASAMKVCAPTTDSRPAFMAALKAAVTEIKEMIGDYSSGW